MPLDLIDIGSNLTHDSFAADRDAVMARAFEAGVRRQVITGADLASSHQAAALAARHPARLWSTAGVHPHHAHSFAGSQRAELIELLQLKHTLPHPKRGLVTVVGSPVRLSDTPVTIASAAPELGADTERYLGGDRFARVIPLRETAREERSLAEET